MEISYAELDNLIRRAALEGAKEAQRLHKVEVLKKTVSVNDAAEILGKDRSTVYKLIKEGKLKTALVGKSQMVTKRSLELIQIP